MRAGKPTVIAAFFADQPFWGWLNERNGTGPPALYTERAREIAARIAVEEGAARAAELIESSVRGP